MGSETGKHLEIAVLGTDTGVGKSRVLALLAQGLRARGRRVWVHKPVACGGWLGGQAEDGRALATLADPGQPSGSHCPYQFPEAASPHLAARAAGAGLDLDDLVARLRQLRGDHDLLVEGVGGLLVPLTPRRETVCDYVVAAGLAALIVTRPHLGTLNHTALTVAHARRRGIRLLGLVLNHHAADSPATLAVRSAAGELAALTELPVLAELPYRPHLGHGSERAGQGHAAGGDSAVRLADAVLAGHTATGR